jgi:hypothetical protein
MIYRHESSKTNLHGWKIYNTLNEIEEIKKYYSERKLIDFFISNTTLKYNSYDELMLDIEVLPITEERAEALLSIFEDDTFGDFPI